MAAMVFIIKYLSISIYLDAHFHNELKCIFGHGHVTDYVITLNLTQVIFQFKCYFHVGLASSLASN